MISPLFDNTYHSEFIEAILQVFHLRLDYTGGVNNMLNCVVHGSQGRWKFCSLMSLISLSFIIPSFPCAQADSVNIPLAPLSTVLDKGFDGLSSEIASQERLDILLKQARTYSEWKKNRLSVSERINFIATCSKDKTNPFCALTVLNPEALRSIKPPKKGNRSFLARVVSLFRRASRPSQWDKLKGLSLHQIHHIFKTIDHWERVRPLVEHALNKDEKIPSELLIAVAQKSEEFFPQKVTFQTALSIYSRALEQMQSIENSQEITELMQKTAFRIAMLHMIQNNCELAEPYLKISENSSNSAFAPRALYWHRKCRLKVNDEEKAEELAQRLISERPLTFHALLLIEETKQNPSVLLSSQEPLLNLRSGDPTLDQNLRLAELLYRIGSHQLASPLITRIAQVVDQRTEKDSDLAKKWGPFSLYLASLKYKAGEYQSAFALTADALRENQKLFSRPILRLLYPNPHHDIISKFAQDIDPLLITALVRQESAFNPGAKSQAGARGLMQMLPQTARRFERFVWAKKLFQPETNVRLGTKYFRSLLSRFGNRVELSLAAYNAGELKVESWEERYVGASPTLLLELIPYSETREYVSIIVRNYYWYRWMSRQAEFASTPGLSPQDRKPASTSLAFTIPSLSTF